MLNIIAIIIAIIIALLLEAGLTVSETTYYSELRGWERSKTKKTPYNPDRWSDKYKF